MADEVETLKKEIIDGVKDEVVKSLDDILKGKFVSYEEFEKVASKLKEQKTVPDNTKSEVSFKEWLGKAIKKGLAEGTGSAGGYTVPPEYSTQIWQLQQKFAQIANKCTQITVGTNEFHGVSLVNDVNVSWTDENASISETTPSFGNPTITIKKLTALVKISNELLEDTKADLDPLIFALVSRAVAKELDNQLINGNGSPFTGVLNASGVVNVVSGAALADVLEYDDIVKVENAISSDYALNPTFTLHRNVVSVIRRLKDNDGRPLNIIDVKDRTLDGIPYIKTERAPGDTTTASSPILIYGDWSNAIVARRKTLTMQVLKERYADNDQTGLKFVARYGITIMAPEAFVVLKTAAS